MPVPFSIKLLDIRWLNGANEMEDLCAHGEIFIRIGTEIVSNTGSGEWTVSAAALFLLRTLNKNYTPGEMDNFLIPCCGFTMWVLEKDKPVTIYGCNCGIDWSVNHVGNSVELVTESGGKTILPFEDYKQAVLGFARKVEQFYDNSLPKTLPTDAFDLDGYNAFWSEWKQIERKYL